MKSTQTSIGIAGIGGIGGFAGALLAKTYKNDPATKIIFICRDETKDIINTKGLTVESKGQINTIQPNLASDDPKEIGKLDILIIATKSYALDTVINRYKDCIGNDTVIIPLQNMVNAEETIRQHLPDKGKIAEGCIYIASNLHQKAHVRHVGGPGKIFIGGNSENKWVIEPLQKGGLDISFADNIKDVLWKKSLFVAPVAAITTAYNINFGQLRESTELMTLLEKMMLEIQVLAKVNHISLLSQDVEAAKELLHKFPYDAKSSLQLDVEQGKTQTEKYFFVDFVIENCLKHTLDVQHYQQVNEQIKTRLLQQS